MSKETQHVQAEIAKVRELFIERIHLVLPQLESLLASARASQSISEYLNDESCQHVHKIAGTAKIFGFTELGLLAEKVEVYFSGIKDESIEEDIVHAECLRAIAALLHEMRKISL